MKQTSDPKITEFLSESNAIEGVYDRDSLTQAYKAWLYLRKQKILTAGVVLDVHRVLMENQNIQDHEKGYFRNCDVFIGGRMGVSAGQIPRELLCWLDDMNKPVLKSKKGYTQEAISQLLHVQYEHIHPFIDGNGRTGRMFMNWFRIKNNMPLLIIHEGAEQMDYYKWFK